MKLAGLVPIALLLGGVAHAEVPLTRVIAVQAVTATAPDAHDRPLWQLLTSGLESWCNRGKPGAMSEPLTITLAAPTVIDAIVITPDQLSNNKVASVEVTVDGKPHLERVHGNDATTIAVGNASVSQLVVRVSSAQVDKADIACIHRIELRTTPPSVVVVGADAAGAAALVPDIVAIKDAFRACEAKGFQRIAYPFTQQWYAGGDAGMDEHVQHYKNAAAVAKACKRKKFKSLAKLAQNPLDLRPTGPGKVELVEDVTWELELVDGRWKLRAVHDG